MNRLIMLAVSIMALLAIGLAGCNDTEKAADDTIVVKSGDSHEGETAEEHAAHSGETSATGTTTVTEVVLASGEKLAVHPVAKLDLDPKSVEGHVALEGKVQDIHTDKGVFSLVDCKQEAGCKDGCCPNVNIPISVPTAEYDGAMPSKDANVIVIGNLKVSNAGYLLTVEEVRQGDTVLLSRKAADKSAGA
jgi:hypothetical protein